MTRYREHPEKRGVGHVAGSAAAATAKGTFKLVAFILNFFIPGLGTFFVGRIGTAIIQLVLLPVGVLLIPFGGIGVLVLVADWVWALVTVVQAWRRPRIVYVRQNPPL